MGSRDQQVEAKRLSGPRRTFGWICAKNRKFISQSTSYHASRGRNLFAAQCYGQAADHDQGQQIAGGQEARAVIVMGICGKHNEIITDIRSQDRKE